MVKIHITIIIIFVTCFQGVFAQQVHRDIDNSDQFTINFSFDTYIIDRNYMNNSMILSEIDSLLKNDKMVNSLDSIYIVGTSSPDGVLEHNIWLAKKRSTAIKGYFILKYPNIDKKSIR